MTVRAVRMLGLIASLAIAGCSTSPDPTLYTLAAAPGPAVPGGPRIVVVRDISLARYLDRPQIVRASDNYLLDVSKGDWWGEPLGRMIDRVLVEELTQRLPGSTVIAGGGAITADADAAVEVNVQTFAGDSSGQVVLDAQAAVTRNTNGNIRTITRRFTATPADGSARAQVAAMSTVLGQFADAVADAVRTAK